MLLPRGTYVVLWRGWKTKTPSSWTSPQKSLSRLARARAANINRERSSPFIHSYSRWTHPGKHHTPSYNNRHSKHSSTERGPPPSSTRTTAGPTLENITHQVITTAIRNTALQREVLPLHPLVQPLDPPWKTSHTKL